MADKPITTKNIKVDSNTVSFILTGVSQDVLKQYGELYINMVKGLYTDHEVSESDWFYRLHLRKGKSGNRMTIVIACTNPNIPFIEAKYGRIAEVLNAQKTSAPIKVTFTRNGFVLEGDS